MLALRLRNIWLVIMLLLLGGCGYLPQITRQPNVFNPFPQLTTVAVVPFFNHSAEPTVDGRQFALAYAAELQNVPGFEVVPVGIVEQKLQEYRLTFAGAQAGHLDARKLAQLLDVDAVVVGAVTDYSPYYPPRVGIEVEWHAANPGFHPIPPGYGLPWGTQEEEDIPDAVIFEAERALAREQLKTQTPYFEVPQLLPPPPPQPAPPAEGAAEPPSVEAKRNPEGIRLLAGESAIVPVAPQGETLPGPAGIEEDLQPADEGAIAGNEATALPPDWPDPRGFAPPPPSACRPPLRESKEPVMKHVRLFVGTDPRVTAALQSYVYYRDEARFGGWQSYLQRSDDYIRFCCHMHIAEMLTARGGAGQTRVVWRWPTGR
jgi:hypothetical protein